MDTLIHELNGAEAIQLMKRFLDDFFIIFLGSSIELHDLFQKINNIHPTIKFTMNHTTNSDEEADQKCDRKEQLSIPFLDVLCTIQDGRMKNRPL